EWATDCVHRFPRSRPNGRKADQPRDWLFAVAPPEEEKGYKPDAPARDTVIPRWRVGLVCGGFVPFTLLRLFFSRPFPASISASGCPDPDRCPCREHTGGRGNRSRARLVLVPCHDDAVLDGLVFRILILVFIRSIRLAIKRDMLDATKLRAWLHRRRDQRGD